MRRSAYLKQLEADLEKWADAGLIERERIPALLADAGPTVVKRSLAAILAFLGAIMLACAVVAFVGANWQVLPRLFKLGLLIAAMWTIYGTGLVALRRQQPLFTQAAVLLGCAMFGANIMLIGQTYHINAGWPSGVLIWGLGALLAAVVVPSRAASAFAAGLLTLWTVSSVTEAHWVFHWPYLPALALLVGFGLWQGWAPIIHLSVIGFGIWSVTNTVSVTDHLDIENTAGLFALIGLSLAVWLAGRLLARHPRPFGNIVSGYGLCAVAASVFALQWADSSGMRLNDVAIAGGVVGIPVIVLAGLARATAANPIGLRGADLAMVGGVLLTGLAVLWTGYPPQDENPYILALLYLLFIVWLLNYGLARQRAFPATLALVAFAAEVITLYFMTFDTLLNRSALFAIGGVLFIVSAIVLERVRHRLIGGVS